MRVADLIYQLEEIQRREGNIEVYLPDGGHLGRIFIEASTRVQGAYGVFTVVDVYKDKAEDRQRQTKGTKANAGGKAK